MDFNSFMGKVKEINQFPTSYFQTALLNAIRFANPQVKSNFFAADAVQPYSKHNSSDMVAAFDELAIKYLTYTISTNTSWGFNKTVQNVSSNVLVYWMNYNTGNVGRNLLLDYLDHPDRFAQAFSDGPSHARMIADNAANTVFFNGFMTETFIKGYKVPVYVFLTILKALDTNGDQLKRVTEAWSANVELWEQVKNYNGLNWLYGVENYFSQGNEGWNTVNTAVTNMCNTGSDYNYVKQRSYGGQGGSAASAPRTYDEHWKRTSYGVGVINWLNSGDGPSRYGLRSGNGPDNTTDVCTDAGGSASSSGCIIYGTPVLLANGTHKPIEDIVEGDQLLSIDGNVSECSAEFLVNDEISEIYGINDDAPFLTFEHAVMTDRGWCSLAPQISMELTPDIKVYHLNRGDVVWKVAGIENDKVVYSKVVVEHIPIQVFAPGEGPKGYVIHIREGRRSYHAGGYCCFEGYPQITASYIMANVLSNMDSAEQHQFNNLIIEQTPLLSKAFGPHVVKAFSSTLKAPSLIASRASHTNQSGKIKNQFMTIQEKIIPRFIIVPQTTGVSLPSNFEQMTLINGNLFINDEAVNTEVHDGHICWHRVLPNGEDETGALKFSHNGLMAEGIVSHGGVTTHFKALANVDYSTSYQTDTGNITWLDFEMGFKKGDDGACQPFGKITDPTGAIPQDTLDLYSSSVFSLAHKDKLTQLHVDVEFSAVWCSFGGSEFIAAEFDFTMDYHTFQGKLYKYDENKEQNRGKAYDISGIYKNTAQLQQMFNQLQTSRSPEKNTLFSRQLAHAASLMVQLPLSVNDLFTLPVPDLENVHKQSFAKLKNLMLYSIDDQWLKWFGEARPKVDGIVLTQNDVAILDDKDVKPFLTDKFAIGYLTQAFSLSTDPKIQESFRQLSDVSEKLGYFWKGSDGDTCFAKDPGYNVATSKLMSNTYTENVPGLAAYMADNPAEWAKKLYNFCVQEPTLTGLALQNTLDGRARLTHLSSVLYALDPDARIVGSDPTKKVAYASSLYEKVMDCRLNIVMKNFTKAGEEDFVEFLTEYFRQYFNSIIAGDTWQDSIRNEALKDLQELMEEYNVDNVNALVEHMGSIIVNAVQVLQKASSLPFAKRLNDWAKANPTVGRAISTGLSMAVYGFAMFQSIKAFLDWDNLKPQDKVMAVATMLDTSANIFKDYSAYKSVQSIARSVTPVVDVMKASEEVSVLQAKVGSTEAANRFAVQAEPALNELDSAAMIRGGEAAGAATVEAGDVIAASSKWTKISKIAGGFATAMTILALGAACVCTGFEIADDFKTGQPTSIKVLDILSIIANGVGFLAEAGVGIAALVGVEVCSAIPVVGVVFAVIGLGIAIALMFIHRNPPPTPEEEFVDNHSKSFINGLKQPSLKWLDQQKKLDEHLNGAG